MASATTAKGYGWPHQRLRAALLQALVPSSPCPRCGQGMWPEIQALDLGHVDGDKTRYSGLEHARCNRSGGATYGNRLRGRDGTVTRNRQRRRRRWPPPEPPPQPSPRSRTW
jgi:hypothetical protein